MVKSAQLISPTMVITSEVLEKGDFSGELKIFGAILSLREGTPK